MGLEREVCGRAEVLHGNTKGIFKELLLSHLPESKSWMQVSHFTPVKLYSLSIAYRPEKAHGKFQHEV